MMDTTLMSPHVTVYDGLGEALTIRHRRRANNHPSRNPSGLYRRCNLLPDVQIGVNHCRVGAAIIGVVPGKTGGLGW